MRVYFSLSPSLSMGKPANVNAGRVSGVWKTKSSAGGKARGGKGLLRSVKPLNKRKANMLAKKSYGLTRVAEVNAVQKLVSPAELRAISAKMAVDK